MRNRREQREVFEREHGVLPLKCAECKKPVVAWGRLKGEGNVHHIDGDSSNNASENLMLLHHDCHARLHTSARSSSQQAAASNARWAKPQWANARARANAERERLASQTREEMIAARNASIRAAYATGQPQRLLSERKRGVPKPVSFRQRSQCPGCGRMLTPSWLGRHAKSGCST